MITFYSVDTANGQKVAILLKLLELDHAVRPVDLYAGEHRTEEFLRISPTGRLPVITDHDAPGGQPLTIYGTLAIALYLAEKTGKLLPSSPAERAHVIDTAAMLASDLAPALSGQFVFSELIPQEGSAVTDYFEDVVHRMLRVVNAKLEQHEFVAGDAMSIADVLLFPVAETSLARMPGALERYAALQRWRDAARQHPAFRQS